MKHTQTATKRWVTAARWPVGVGIAYWRYMWSVTPVHRWEMSGSWPQDAGPDLPASADPEELQLTEEGVGPLVHRIYRTRIVGSGLAPAELMGRMTADLDQVAPSEFATFQRLGEPREGIAAGDEYVVRMPGPWDGPVRIIDAGPTSFRFATLPGHLEAGQIEFRARGDHRSIWFEIESWARSGDRWSDLLYAHLRVSKEVQLHMWSSVLRRVVGLSGGRMDGGIVIVTRLVPEEELPGPNPGPKVDRRRQARLHDLAGRHLNFDPAELADFPAERGRHQDDLVEALPTEPSGPPVEGGSWQVARALMNAYQLADPRVVTATYEGSTPLESRDMLLHISFKGLRLWVGVRIGDPWEETRVVDGREVRVFGWSYDTLEGHFEEGRMHYELWKWLDTGEVEFHLRAISRPARGGSPLIRLGFRAFGRTQQLRFYHQVCRRVRRLTEAQLETERAAGTPA